MYTSYSVVVSDSLQPHGLSMKFSRQEYWSGLPFPSPGDLPNPGTKAGSLSLQADYLFSELQGKPILKILANYMIDTVERKMQCFKEASFSFNRHLKVKVAQSRPTLCDPMDYSPWVSPGQSTGVGCLSLLQEIFAIQGSNPGLPNCRFFTS